MVTFLAGGFALIVLFSGAAGFLSHRSWIIFSRVDGLHLERPDLDARCALDRAVPQPETVPRAGAAYLLVSHDRLHLRDLDSVLPKLTCIKSPHL